MQDAANTQPGPDPGVDLERREAASRFLAEPARSLVDAACGTRVAGHIDLGPEHHTPWGVVHGGVYTTAVETAASIGASLAVRDRGQFAVGVQTATRFPPRLPRAAPRLSPSPCSRAVSSNYGLSPSPTSAAGARTWPDQAAERSVPGAGRSRRAAPPGGSTPGSVAFTGSGACEHASRSPRARPDPLVEARLGRTVSVPGPRTVSVRRVGLSRSSPGANLNDSGVGRGWLLIVLCRFSAVVAGRRRGAHAIPGGDGGQAGGAGAAGRSSSWRGPVPEHCLAQRFCFGVRGDKVGGLRDFPFGVGDDDLCLVTSIAVQSSGSSPATSAQASSSRSSASATVGSWAP